MRYCCTISIRRSVEVQSSAAATRPCKERAAGLNWPARVAAEICRSWTTRALTRAEKRPPRRRNRLGSQQFAPRRRELHLVPWLTIQHCAANCGRIILQFARVRCEHPIQLSVRWPRIFGERREALGLILSGRRVAALQTRKASIILRSPTTRKGVTNHGYLCRADSVYRPGDSQHQGHSETRRRRNRRGGENGY